MVLMKSELLLGDLTEQERSCLATGECGKADNLGLTVKSGALYLGCPVTLPDIVLVDMFQSINTCFYIFID